MKTSDMRVVIQKKAENFYVVQCRRSVGGNRPRKFFRLWVILVTGYILSVNFGTLKQELMCPNCKCIVGPDEIVRCSFCNTMTTLDCCKKKNDIISSAQGGAWKLTLSVQRDIFVVTFGIPLDEKFKLATSMLKVEVKIRYSLVDNKVITLEKVHI